jgi:hypothetical protein
MKWQVWLGATVLLGTGIVWGCTSDTTAEPSPAAGAGGGAAGQAGNTSAAGTSAGGTAGTSAAGAAGTSAGGSAGTSAAGAAGTSAGGTAGTSAAGAAGTSAGGAAGAQGFAWEGTYDSSGNPADHTDGHHNPGQDCLGCHDGNHTGQGAPKFLFAGTAYDSTGATAVAHAQVAVKDSTALYATYSGTNGNFWKAATGNESIAWASATAAIRDQNGEDVMTGSQPAAGCNGSCHGASNRITAP